MFATYAEFLANFSDEGPTSTLFCPTKVPADTDDEVVVDVTVSGQPHPIRLVGHVLSHITGHGIWVQIGVQSRASATYLKNAGHPDAPPKPLRAHPRYPASLPVQWKADAPLTHNGNLAGQITDLSRGGAFVTGSHLPPPPVGTRVSLLIAPQNNAEHPAQSYCVNGRVAWTETKDAGGGFGVCFDRHGTQNAALRMMLRRASETGEVGLQ